MISVKKVLIIRQMLGRTTAEVTVYCRDAFRDLGVTTDIVNYAGKRLSSRLPFLRTAEMKYAEARLLRAIGSFKPDLAVVVKGTEIPVEAVEKVRKAGVPVACYWIDDPMRFDTAAALAPHYDHFFSNAVQCMDKYRSRGVNNAHFLSFGCAPALHRRMEVSADEKGRLGSDICFAGTIDDRRLEILEALSGFDLKIWARPLVHRFEEDCRVTTTPLAPSSPARAKFTGVSLWGEELVKAYNSSKIVLNIHSPQDAPIMRDFEATGCGAFLLSDPAKGLDAFFRYDNEIAVWKDVDELREKIVRYLGDESEREKIASRGYERSHGSHTYAARMKELLSFVEST